MQHRSALWSEVDKVNIPLHLTCTVTLNPYEFLRIDIARRRAKLCRTQCCYSSDSVVLQDRHEAVVVLCGYIDASFVLCLDRAAGR